MTTTENPHPVRRRRRTGESAGDEKVREAYEDLDVPHEETLPEERAEEFRTPGWQRMRTDWKAEDLPIMLQARRAVDDRIGQLLGDAYEVMFEVYSVVREPVLDEGGEPVIDEHGLPVWLKTPTGNYVEDWSRLTSREKQKWLFTITTRMFSWEQAAADVWAEAMYAKGIFAERHGIGYSEAYLEGKRDRIEDREAAAQVDAAQERYFAIYLSHLSRKAEVIVRSMANLGQRLKDVMVSE